MRPALCHTGRTDQGRGVKWVEMPGELVWSGGSDTGRLSHWILAAAGSASSPLPPATDHKPQPAFTQTGNIECCAAALSAAWLPGPVTTKYRYKQHFHCHCPIVSFHSDGRMGCCPDSSDICQGLGAPAGGGKEFSAFLSILVIPT